MVHGVHNQDVHDADCAEQQPGEESENVVSKDEIIDKTAVAKVDNFPGSEHCHCQQPSNKPTPTTTIHNNQLMPIHTNSYPNLIHPLPPPSQRHGTFTQQQQP